MGGTYLIVHGQPRNGCACEKSIRLPSVTTPSRRDGIIRLVQKTESRLSPIRLQNSHLFCCRRARGGGGEGRGEKTATRA